MLAIFPIPLLLDESPSWIRCIPYAGRDEMDFDTHTLVLQSVLNRPAFVDHRYHDIAFENP
jgi:hypothetical protein